MRRSASGTTALLLAALAALCAAGPAAGDPLNPRHPDYCGNSPDFFFCAEHRSTYPNAGESGFLDATRGRIPGNDAKHLAAGRAACLELAADSAGHVVGDVGNYLQISAEQAGQVVDAAHSNMCPQTER